MELEEEVVAEVLQSDGRVAGGVGLEADQERRLHSTSHLHHQTRLKRTAGQRDVTVTVGRHGVTM